MTYSQGPLDTWNEPLFEVTIENVDYDNAKFFAMSNPFLHLAGPTELVEDVQKEYEQKASEYAGLMKKAAPQKKKVVSVKHKKS